MSMYCLLCCPGLFSNTNIPFLCLLHVVFVCVSFPRLYFVSFSSKFSGGETFSFKDCVFESCLITSTQNSRFKFTCWLSCVCLCEMGGATNKGWVCSLRGGGGGIKIIEDLKRILYIQFSLAFSQELCRVCTRNNDGDDYGTLHRIGRPYLWCIQGQLLWQSHCIDGKTRDFPDLKINANGYLQPLMSCACGRRAGCMDSFLLFVHAYRPSCGNRSKGVIMVGRRVNE